MTPLSVLLLFTRVAAAGRHVAAAGRLIAGIGASDAGLAGHRAAVSVGDSWKQ